MAAATRPARAVEAPKVAAPPVVAGREDWAGAADDGAELLPPPEDGVLGALGVAAGELGVWYGAAAAEEPAAAAALVGA